MSAVIREKWRKKWRGSTEALGPLITWATICEMNDLSPTSSQNPHPLDFAAICQKVESRVFAIGSITQRIKKGQQRELERGEVPIEVHGTGFLIGAGRFRRSSTRLARFRCSSTGGLGTRADAGIRIGRLSPLLALVRPVCAPVLTHKWHMIPWKSCKAESAPLLVEFVPFLATCAASLRRPPLNHRFFSAIDRPITAEF